MLSQETLTNTEDILQEVKEEEVAMDCEGFQDLREWCRPQQIAPLHTPIYTDAEHGQYFQTLEDSIEASSGFCLEDLIQGSSFSTEHNNRSQIELSIPLQKEDFINHNTATDKDFKMADNEHYVFDDMPAYEEVIEVSPSSVDSTNEFINEDTSEPTLSKEMAVTGDDLQWDLSVNLDSRELANNYTDNKIDVSDAMKFCENDVMFSTGIESCTKISCNTVTQNMACIPNTTTSKIIMEYVDISDILLKPKYEKIHTCDLELSSSKVTENNNSIIDTIILDSQVNQDVEFSDYNEDIQKNEKKNDLKLIMKNHANMTPVYTWNENPVVTTPDVLRTIESLETDNAYRLTNTTVDNIPSFPTSPARAVAGTSNDRMDDDMYVLTPPDTPKQTFRKRRRSSEDSDVSYIPESESRRFQKRPKKDKGINETLIQVHTPARRGRPPKRRDSVSSSGTCMDDNMSVMSSNEDKYRERRDKNNEASRRSRYNRKNKEMEMSHMADKLDARNDELRIRAIKLERHTKILKEALMKAMLDK